MEWKLLERSRRELVGEEWSRRLIGTAKSAISFWCSVYCSPVKRPSLLWSGQRSAALSLPLSLSPVEKARLLQNHLNLKETKNKNGKLFQVKLVNSKKTEEYEELVSERERDIEIWGLSLWVRISKLYKFWTERWDKLWENKIKSGQKVN